MADRDHLRQLTMLVCPFPTNVIKEKPGGRGGDYVAHPVVEQRILDVIGPVDFAVIEIVRGDTDTLEGVVVGVLASMTAEIDGQKVTVTEAGDCEIPGNHKHDGGRLKDAASDAYKRCAMRLGVGLHLWARDSFYLFDKLKKADDDKAAG